VNRIDKLPGIADFRPLYLQVKEMMLERMAKNQFKPGDLLPSESRLASMFGVSQGTVRKALDELTAQNLLVRQQGKGTYVATHTVDRALFHFFHLTDDNGHRSLPDSRVLSFLKHRATAQERDKLRLDKNEQVIRFSRIRTLDSDPIIYEHISLPVNRFSGLENHAPADLPNTLYRYYETHFHLAIISAIEKLKAVAANEADVEHLVVDLGQPLLEVDRVAIGHDNVSLEWRLSRCNTTHHHYLTDLD
jgi:GntR family transcriptional regulator